MITNNTEKSISNVCNVRKCMEKYMEKCMLDITRRDKKSNPYNKSDARF